MTVASDLALREGAIRRYLLKIGGLPYVLNQRVAGPDGVDSPLGPYGATEAGFAGKLAPVDADCIAGYRFDEAGSPQTATDVSGNGLTLSSPDAAWPPSVGGLFDGARRITCRDGNTVGSMFERTHGALLLISSVTAMAWVRIWTLPGQLAIVVKKFSGIMSAWSLRYRDDWGALQGVFHLDGIAGDWGCPEYAPTANRPVLGAWHHVATTYDAATSIACTYWDGALQSTRTAAGGATGIRTDAVSGNMYVGWREGGDPAGVMDVDDLFIYDVAKSAAWIADIYSGGVGGLNCLRAPKSEATIALDLATLRVEASSLTFELDDVEDPSDG